MKIVNLDGFTTNPGDHWMGNYGDYKVYDRTTADQVVERAKGANLLIINKTVLDRATLEALRPELEYIGLQSTGYNVVDCAAAKELGITVCNIPAYSGGTAGVCFYPVLYQPGCSAYTGGRKR